MSISDFNVQCGLQCNQDIIDTFEKNREVGWERLLRTLKSKF